MPQPQPNTGFGQGNGNIGGILGALLDLAIPNASADTQNKANQMNQAQTLGPYQEGVKKALKQAGETHATEALQQDVPPQHIEQQSGLSQNDPMQVLSGLIATHLTNQIQDNFTVQQNPVQQDKKQDFNQTNPVMDFFAKIGITPTPQAQLLLTQAAMNRQKIAAGQPAEISLPQAQTQEIQQKIDGAEPIQPKDIATLNRETYSATIQAANDAWQRNTDEIKTMQEQYKALQEGRSGFSKGVGGQTTQMKAMQQAIIAKMKQNQQHLSNMQTLFKNPPRASSENTQKAQQNNSPFQVGQQYNGETIKNVRRIK